MSSRSSTAYANASPSYETYTPRSQAPRSQSSRSSSQVVYDISPSSYRNPSTKRAWVDPASLPNCGDASEIQGNVSPYIKQLIVNTFIAYGAGDQFCFGHHVAKAVKFTEVSVSENADKMGRMEATTVAEVTVAKNMLNGAGMLHGGCVAFLIDNCCSTPLVVLGLVQNVNGVGVTQAMNIMFHSPAPTGACLRITSTSIALGGRIMSARCEVINKDTGSVVASAYLNKMQPASAKL